MAALAEFNRGAALLEQYKYADAAKAFGSVLEVAPHWKAARFNLGVAYFNMHGQHGARESLDAAREAFEEVLAADPGHLHALFCLGLYYQYFGENEKALEHFAAVYRADGEDPYVAYKYAEALIAMGQEDEGTETLEKVVALDPGFVSAVYRLALQYQRARQPDRAMPLFERFKQFNAAELAGGTFIVQKAYGTVGKYYRLLDVDSDGDLDLLAFRLAKGPVPAVGDCVPAATRIHNNNRDGSFTDLAAELGLAMENTAVGTSVYDDFDNDRDLDLVLFPAGDKPPAAWVNDRANRYRILDAADMDLPVRGAIGATSGECPIQLRDVTRQTGVSFVHTDGSSGRRYIVETVCCGLALFDYDGDGDVDVYFGNGAPLLGTKVDVPPKNALYRNDGGVDLFEHVPADRIVTITEGKALDASAR